MTKKLSAQKLHPLLDVSAGIENAPYLVSSLVDGEQDASTHGYASCSDCATISCDVSLRGVRRVREGQGER